MTKWLFRIIWIPVLLLAVLFLVANRTMVPISLDPFRPENPALSTPALPLWFWLMGMLFLGLALGAFGSWMSGRDARIQARQNRRELKAAKKELAAFAAREDGIRHEAEKIRTETALVETDEPPKLEATNI